MARIFTIRGPGTCCLCREPLKVGDKAMNHASFARSIHGCRAHVRCVHLFHKDRKEKEKQKLQTIA